MSNDALEALEAEYEEVEEGTEEIQDVIETEEEVEEEGNEEIVSEENPPGYLSYEDWVDQGKDPDMYKGKKAYEAEYDRIQEVKDLKRTVKGMDDTLKSTVDAITERENKAEIRHRRELEAALAEAKAEGDTEAAIDAVEQLNELKERPVAEVKPTTHPVISEFLDKNPILESADVNAEFARIYNGKLKADGVGPNDQISEVAIRGYARAAMESVKTIFPERFSSPRNKRTTTVKTKAKAATKVDVGQKMRGLKLNVASPQNLGAHFEIYEMIKEKDPAAAETFAKRILGE